MLGTTKGLRPPFPLTTIKIDQNFFNNYVKKRKAPLPKEVVKGAPSSILVDRQESIGDGSVNVIYDWSVRTESSNHNLVDKTC